MASMVNRIPVEKLQTFVDRHFPEVKVLILVVSGSNHHLGEATPGVIWLSSEISIEDFWHIRLKTIDPFINLVKAEAVLVLFHEIMHHKCGHVTEKIRTGDIPTKTTDELIKELPKHQQPLYRSWADTEMKKVEQIQNEASELAFANFTRLYTHIVKEIF